MFTVNDVDTFEKDSYSGTVPRELPVSSKQETKGKSRRATTTRRRTHTRAAAACATSAEETESMWQQRISLHISLTARIHLFLFSVQPHANTSSQTAVPNSHASHSWHCSNARTLRQELGVGWKHLVVNTQTMPCFLVLCDTWFAGLENRRSLKKKKHKNPQMHLSWKMLTF